MKKIFRLRIGVFIVLCSLLGVVWIWLIFISPGTTAPIKDDQGNPVPDSVAVIEFVELGGLKQFVLMRGRNVNNPVLLLLHGGPGTPQSPHFVYYNQELENHFVVVNWDQRGAGRSYSPNIPPESMTISQFISDVHELTQYLKKRFNQKKIYLLGHSWGSYLGIRTAHGYPDDYYAYVGIGQVANQKQSEMLSYQFVWETAKKNKNTEALQSLEALGAPVDGKYKGGAMDMIKQRQWVRAFGGAVYQADNFYTILGKPIVFFREYSLSDKLGYFDGEEFSVTLLFDRVLEFDLMSEIKELKIPIYILQGRHDYQTAFVLAEKFLHNLKAPKKELIPFESSAHMVPYEEPNKFHEVMINKVLKETYHPAN
ncbi:MAG: alpha/beta hydrolase [SAR324 cluster bacterium]|nr:alpha/beta hydrolase [SAR324 cluster bacterium]